MPAKRTSTSAAPAMNQAAIRQLIDNRVAAALEAQAANMANTGNTNRNPKQAPVARKCSYKEFMSCQPFNFKGSERALLIKKYYPWTEIQKMEDEFYHLTVKGNDLKTYVRRFQELATLFPTMVSDSEKLLEAFIEGLPQSIKGSVTASKPQTLEEAINITQSLMDPSKDCNSGKEQDEGLKGLGFGQRNKNKMTTLVEHIIVVGAENYPPMLEKSMYDSWARRIRLFIKGKTHGRMMLDSIDNGLLVYPTVKENRQTRLIKYSELTKAQQIQDDSDVQATNIILYGLPPVVYALVNHKKDAKDTWDKVKPLMKGIELSYEERECKLYNIFNKFAYVHCETLYEYYRRFSQLINDMHTIRMIMQQVQVNTKFLNAFSLEWSKCVTDVKLAKSLYTTNYDQLYAYLSQHEQHAYEVCITRERYSDPLSLVAKSLTLYNPSQSPQHSGSLMYPPPQQFTQQGEDPIECINKSKAFLFTVPSRIATTSKGNYATGQPRVMKCYKYQGEGHMARQCIQPKSPRNFAWFKEKLMLAEAQETEDLDAYDSYCNDLSSAKAVLMANLSSCDPEVLSE
nr:reverse transcriptase domain-containing protein [Tanacetum cinerariifolium]